MLSERFSPNINNEANNGTEIEIESLNPVLQIASRLNIADVNEEQFVNFDNETQTFEIENQDTNSIIKEIINQNQSKYDGTTEE